MSSHSPTTSSDRHASPAWAVRDPRFVIAAFGMIIVSAFILPHASGLFFVFLYILALHRLAGLPRRSLLHALKIVGPFILVVLAVNAVLVEGEPLVRGVPFVSRSGVVSGIHGGTRVLVLYFATAVFLSVVSAEDLAKAISALVRPISPGSARRAAMYGFLSLGFLPLFVDELSRIRVAQNFRGGGLDGGPVAKIHGARLLVVPLVFSAIRRSEQLATAVELRGIRSSISSILELDEASAADYLFFAVTAAVLAAAWIAF